MWNDYERTLMDALGAWENDLHTCGRPMSESLRVIGRPDPEYAVAAQICVGCQQLDGWWATRKDMLEKAHEDGRHPETYMLPRVYSQDELKQLWESQGGSDFDALG